MDVESVHILGDEGWIGFGEVLPDLHHQVFAIQQSNLIIIVVETPQDLHDIPFLSSLLVMGPTLIGVLGVDK